MNKNWVSILALVLMIVCFVFLGLIYATGGLGVKQINIKPVSKSIQNLERAVIEYKKEFGLNSVINKTMLIKKKKLNLKIDYGNEYGVEVQEDKWLFYQDKMILTGLSWLACKQFNEYHGLKLKEWLNVPEHPLEKEKMYCFGKDGAYTIENKYPVISKEDIDQRLLEKINILTTDLVKMYNAGVIAQSQYQYELCNESNPRTSKKLNNDKVLAQELTDITTLLEEFYPQYPDYIVACVDKISRGSGLFMPYDNLSNQNLCYAINYQLGYHFDGIPIADPKNMPASGCYEFTKVYGSILPGRSLGIIFRSNGNMSKPEIAAS